MPSGTEWRSIGKKRELRFIDMDELDYLGKETKHFLGYHSTDGMGYPMPGKSEDGYVFLSRKSVQNMAGNTIWMIEGVGRPKKYLFRGRYVVDYVTSDKEDEQLYYLVGERGTLLEHEVVLNNEVWFPGLRRMQGNFGFGIQALREEYVDEFKILLSKHT